MGPSHWLLAIVKSVTGYLQLQNHKELKPLIILSGQTYGLEYLSRYV